MSHIAEPDRDAIGRHVARLAETPDRSEEFMRGMRAGIEASAAALKEVAALPDSRTARVRMSIVLTKAAETLLAYARPRVSA